ncbi:carbohydrate kinase family protein [Paenibacillus herberti]|uniref:Carbohydrate kinase family protein n=1 Tax=Paenibacillus herberti TaxID=1619309 RepID=A0A229NU20_9BACL|nr:carbohydrate kinase family protein [Paenibacillus herberti]OXM13338.1 carbohydrate kinase family protein [Paenibacillus herberti]
MRIYDAVVIGDANIDLVVEGFSQVPQPGQEIFVDRMTMHVGGGAALFAVSLAKLGIRVAFNGVLGDDNYGHYIRERFEQYGIDTRMIRNSDINNTGISIAFNPETDRSFITYAGSNAELRMDTLDFDEIAQGRHVHITGYRGRRNHDQYVEMTKELKERGVSLSCDVGWDDSGEWDNSVFQLMQDIDVFLMNETEAQHYTGMSNIEDCIRHMGKYCDHVVIKLGAEGAIALKDDVLTRLPGYSVVAVDTTGAGDSFNAGYLFGFLNGMDVETSLQYGNACGALSVGSLGGSTGTPDLEGLKAFLREHEDEHEVRT